MGVGKIIKAEVITAANGERWVLKEILLTNEAGRVWRNFVNFTVYNDPAFTRAPHHPEQYRIVCGEIICPEHDSLAPLWSASPDQVNEFVQEGDTLHWPGLGVSIAMDGAG